MLKTKLHYYYFQLDKPEEKVGWKELREKLRAAGVKHFHAHGGTQAECKNETVEVEIETAHLFNDQWNTAAPHNSRVFDWFQQYELNRANCARGHWLEITPEMVAARAETLECGYCGQQYGPHHESHRHDIPADGFCDACLDSPYLKEKELYLLRLLPISGNKWTMEKLPELTGPERAVLIPRYTTRQTTGADSRANQKRLKQREDLDLDWNKTVTDATTKRDGLIWIWEKGFSLENVIFYGHTQTFSFGWRGDGLSDEVAEKIRVCMEGFPFKWEVKTAKGERLAAAERGN